MISNESCQAQRERVDYCQCVEKSDLLDVFLRQFMIEIADRAIDTPSQVSQPNGVSLMKPVHNDIIEQQLAWRYATKVFDPARKISETDWQTLENSLILCPSSFGLQPWKFFVITDVDVKAKLKPATWNQSQVVDASHVVVFATVKDLSVDHIDRFVARTAEVRGTTVDALAGFRKMLVGTMINPPFDVNEWAARQCYIAIGFFMATAAMLGIDVCPIEGFESPKYDDILDLGTQGYSSCVVAAVGYRSSTDKYATMPKVRYKPEDIVKRI